MPRAHCRVLVAAFAKELAIAVFGHPSGTGKMAVVNAPCAFRLGVGIDSKDHGDGLAPIGTIRRRIEDTHIFLHVRPVIVREYGAFRWLIQKSWLFHSSTPNRKSISVIGQYDERPSSSDRRMPA